MTTQTARKWSLCVIPFLIWLIVSDPPHSSDINQQSMISFGCQKSNPMPATSTATKTKPEQITTAIFFSTPSPVEVSAHFSQISNSLNVKCSLPESIDAYGTFRNPLHGWIGIRRNTSLSVGEIGGMEIAGRSLTLELRQVRSIGTYHTLNQAIYDLQKNIPNKTTYSGQGLVFTKEKLTFNMLHAAGLFLKKQNQFGLILSPKIPPTRFWIQSQKIANGTEMIGMIPGQIKVGTYTLYRFQACTDIRTTFQYQYDTVFVCAYPGTITVLSPKIASKQLGGEEYIGEYIYNQPKLINGEPPFPHDPPPFIKPYLN